MGFSLDDFNNVKKMGEVEKMDEECDRRTM